MPSRDPSEPVRNRDMQAYSGLVGLSKREAAAIAAMQGLLANPQVEQDVQAVERELGSVREAYRRGLATIAVGMADALFDELDKEE